VSGKRRFRNRFPAAKIIPALQDGDGGLERSVTFTINLNANEIFGVKIRTGAKAQLLDPGYWGK
jgi:hypothetical protein